MTPFQDSLTVIGTLAAGLGAVAGVLIAWYQLNEIRKASVDGARAQKLQLIKIIYDVADNFFKQLKEKNKIEDEVQSLRDNQSGTDGGTLALAEKDLDHAITLTLNYAEKMATLCVSFGEDAKFDFVDEYGHTMNQLCEAFPDKLNPASTHFCNILAIRREYLTRQLAIKPCNC